VCNELGKYGRHLTAIVFGIASDCSSLSEYSPWNSLADKASIIVDAVLDFYDDSGDLDETKEKLFAE